MARRAGRSKPTTPKAGVTKTHRRYAWEAIDDISWKDGNNWRLVQI